MQGALLILELFVGIFLTGMGAMFFILEVGADQPARIEAIAIAAAFCLVGLALGSHGFRRLRTRGLLLAGAGIFGLSALGGILALVALGVTAWLAVVALGLLGVLACVLRLRDLR